MKHMLILIAILFSLTSHAQIFQNITLKAGGGIALQSKTPQIANDNNDLQSCYAFGVETEFNKFGPQKKMALSVDILYLKKGGRNTSNFEIYDENNQLTGSGSMSVPVKLTYFSFAPNFKYDIVRHFFVKLGPRMDIFIDHAFTQLPPGIPAPESSYTFMNTCYGISYAVGGVVGENKLRLLMELMGQSDFTQSSKNSSTGQSFKNNAFVFNLGLVYILK